MLSFTVKYSDGQHMVVHLDENGAIAIEQLKDKLSLVEKPVSAEVNYYHGSHDALRKIREDGGN